MRFMARKSNQAPGGLLVPSQSHWVSHQRRTKFKLNS